MAIPLRSGRRFVKNAGKLLQSVTEVGLDRTVAWRTVRPTQQEARSRVEVFLFIPCLVEHVSPEIGLATQKVLTAAGVSPVVPAGQTCCGQFAFKRGRPDLVAPLARRFIEIFEAAPAVVCPSGSCTAMVRRYPELFAADDPWQERARRLAERTFELGQFLVEELSLVDLGARLPLRAVLHESCQMTRALGAGGPTRELLARVRGLELVPLADPQRCCGFGGAFSLDYPELGQAIVEEKVDDIKASGAQAVIAAEPSCLLNIASVLAKRGLPVRTLHLAQVLAGEGA
jgi:L-lactate dehydrogenase complex protein LldE